MDSLAECRVLLVGKCSHSLVSNRHSCISHQSPTSDCRTQKPLHAWAAGTVRVGGAMLSSSSVAMSDVTLAVFDQ